MEFKLKYCCCCGEQCYGKQWWNRDTGYGICKNCVERQKLNLTEKYGKDFADREIKECYGIEKIHYNIEEKIIQKINQEINESFEEELIKWKSATDL